MQQKLLKDLAMAAVYAACPLGIMLGLYLMLMIE